MSTSHNDDLGLTSIPNPNPLNDLVLVRSPQLNQLSEGRVLEDLP